MAVILQPRYEIKYLHDKYWSKADGKGKATADELWRRAVLGAFDIAKGGPTLLIREIEE